MHEGSKLAISNVSKVFGEMPVLEQISFSVAPGEFVVVVGPSGCGKSTLLGLIAGFDAPTSGEIKLDGKPIGRPGLDRLVMFQDHGLFPWLKVIDNVAFGLRAKGIPKQERRSIARQFLSLVHLEGFENALVHQLSGGMRHRVALARALAPDPEILLVDEPFSALDTVTKLHLYTELESIFLKTKKTIVSVTHDTREAACLADRILILSPRPGQLVEEIKVDLPRPRDIMSREVIELSDRIIRTLKQIASYETAS